MRQKWVKKRFDNNHVFVVKLIYEKKKQNCNYHLFHTQFTGSHFPGFVSIYSSSNDGTVEKSIISWLNIDIVFVQEKWINLRESHNRIEHWIAMKINSIEVWIKRYDWIWWVALKAESCLTEFWEQKLFLFTKKKLLKSDQKSKGSGKEKFLSVFPQTGKRSTASFTNKIELGTGVLVFTLGWFVSFFSLWPGLAWRTDICLFHCSALQHLSQVFLLPFCLWLRPNKMPHQHINGNNLFFLLTKCLCEWKKAHWSPLILNQKRW